MWDWRARVDTVELRISKLRRSASLLEFPEPRRTAEKALTAVIQEANVQGLLTRSADDQVRATGMNGISKSQVSRLCGEIDDRVREPLGETFSQEALYHRDAAARPAQICRMDPEKGPFASAKFLKKLGIPYEIRTRVTAVKGR